MDYEKVLGERKFPTYEELKTGLLQLIDEGKISREDASRLLPELRESEDERIRTSLYTFFRGMLEGHEDCYKVGGFVKFEGIDVKSILAWLEKQKGNTEGDFSRGYDCGYQAGYAIAKNEMKPKVATATLDSEKQKEQKLNIELIQRSWYMEGYHDREFGMEPKWIIKTGEGGPKHELNPKYGQSLAENSKEQKFVEIDEIIRKARSEGRQEVIDNPEYYQLLKPEEMQKPAEKQDYSELNDLERAILRGFLCAGVKNVPVGIIKDTASECMGFLALIEPVPAEWSEEDKNMWTHLNGYLNGFSCSEDAIKQMADWFYELPNRFNLQPKQEWSEEDETIIEGACNALEIHGHTKLASMLKSLRPSWKPSDEQIFYLSKAIKTLGEEGDCKTVAILNEIRLEIKKL